MTTSSASPEVVIVGAGIAGAATAFHLSCRGIRTTLLERDHPASGPTGRSSAIVHAFYLEPELSQLARRGTDMLRHLPELTGGPSDFHAIGMLWVTGADQAAAWAAAAERIKAEGADIEVLTPAGFRDLAPGFIADDIALAVWEPTCGYADPAASANSLTEAARRRGADIRLHTPVRSLLVESDRVTGVYAADGQRIGADVVVLATGPWTGPLLREAGVSLPLTVERHPMAVLEGPGARAAMPFCWCDDLLSTYARPEGDHQVLVGMWAGGGTGNRNPEVNRGTTVDDPTHYDEHADLDESSEILRHISPRVPALTTLGVRRGYAGLYDMSPDDLPVIGPVPGLDGVIIIAGSSGHGFKLGPAVGEAVADLIQTGSHPLLAPLLPARFTAD